MALTISHGVPDADADPFRERSGPAFSVRKQLLGGDFRFDSASAALLQVVEAAYAGLPPHRLPVAAPEFRIELRLLPRHGFTCRSLRRHKRNNCLPALSMRQRSFLSGTMCPP